MSQVLECLFMPPNGEFWGDLSAEMEYSLISTLKSTSLSGSMSYELLIVNISVPVHAGRDPKNIQTLTAELT